MPMSKKNLKKISLRIDDEILNEIDSKIDNIRIRNRSDSIRFLVNKAIGKEKIAVILNKGSDLDKDELESKIRLDNKEYALLAKLENGKTLVEEQIRLLDNYGFTKIYIITISKIIDSLKMIFKYRQDINYVQNNTSLKSLDALRLLKGAINSDFLLFFGHNYPKMNLKGIFEFHTTNNFYATLNLTYSIEESYSYVEVDGTTIIKFIERNSEKSHLTYNAVSVLNPKIFDEKGQSLVYDLYPRLAKEEIMHGFITRKRIPRLKKAKDKQRIMDAIHEFEKEINE